MAGFVARGVVVLAVLGVGAVATGAEKAVELRERGRPGEATRVLVVLKAEGLYRPGPPPAAAKDAPKSAKPLALRVEMRLDFAERVLDANAEGRAARTARRVVQAASAINGEVRPSSAMLRPERALLVAERRDAGVVVSCPSGPLTRPELEVVQGVGDPLALPALLPGKAVAPGDTWRPAPRPPGR